MAIGGTHVGARSKSGQGVDQQVGHGVSGVKQNVSGRMGHVGNGQM